MSPVTRHIPALLLLLLWTCPALVAQEVVEVQVSPQELALEVGASARLFFSAFDARGNLADSPVFQLTTSDPEVVKIDSDGTVTGVAAGRATLTVRSGKGSATVTVRVGQAVLTNDRPAGVDRIVVSPPPSPDPLSLVVGASFRFDVRPLAGGNAAPPPVSWSLSDTVVARFDPATKTLEALHPGTADLTAQVPGLAEVKWRVRVLPVTLALAPVTVLRPGQGRVLKVAAEVDEQAVGSGTPMLRWRSDDTTVATVDAAGRLQAKGLGRARVTVEAPGATATTTVFVVADLVVSVAGERGEGTGLYQVDLASGDLSPLLVDAANNLYPQRSPAGDVVAFASDRDGKFGLYTMRSDGSELALLAGPPGHRTQPVWDPDGRSLVYTGTESGAPGLYRLFLDDGRSERLTAGDSASHSPAISPDGARLAFVHGLGPAGRIYMLDANGGTVRPARLAEPGRTERQPAFFPNGDLAAVVQIGTTASAIVRWDRRLDRRVPLVTSDGTIVAYAISRDGRFLAAVVESSASRAAERADLLVVDMTTLASRTVSLTLPAGKRLSHLAY